LTEQEIRTNMDASQTIWPLALALVFFAGWIDWRTRRLPNWLTVPSLLLGVVVHTWSAGWHGAVTALEGAGLGLLILLPLVLMRALGAGDWKLMGALGALLGPHMFLSVLLASIGVSGLMALFLMVHAKRVKVTLRNLFSLVQGLLTFGLRVHPEISLDNTELLKLPFGVAAAGGTLICFLAARWGSL
jgi:prepilin peptidase CpaA